MKASAWVVVLAATMSLASCKKEGGSTADHKAAVAPGVTSAAIDQLIADVPGNAIAIGFVDVNVAPWTYITGGMGLLDEATRKTLDTELRAYIDRFIGVDVSKLQYAVAFVSGPPPVGAVLLKTVGGTPKIPGAADYEGAKVWRLDPSDHISLAMKGDTVILGQDDAVRAVLDTMAQKRKSVAVENKALVDWLHGETKGAAVGFAAVVPKDLPLPPQIAGIGRLALSLDRVKLRAVIDGEDAAITGIQKQIDQVIEMGMAQTQRAHDEAIAGNIPPPEGVLAIIGAAYAKSFVAMIKPRREGNRLVSSFDLQAQGTEGMMMMSSIGIMTAVAIPAFMDYMKKSKKSEAAIQLNRIGKNLKVYYMTESKFPVGEAPLTPAESCCNVVGGKCTTTPDMWQQPMWQALDFQIDEPTMFQYRYRSDGNTAVVEAVGDLDCDGMPITYRLDVAAPNGNPTATITEPAPNSD